MHATCKVDKMENEINSIKILIGEIQFKLIKLKILITENSFEQFSHFSSPDQILSRDPLPVEVVALIRQLNDRSEIIRNSSNFEISETIDSLNRLVVLNSP